MAERCRDCRYRNNRVPRLLEHAAESHLSCYTCNLSFVDYNALHGHFFHDHTHHYCRLCTSHFSSNEEFIAHVKEKHEIYCEDCNYRPFATAFGLLNHRLYSRYHNWCQPCRRDFASESNLDQHLRSKTHKGADVDCPRQGCTSHFVSNGALFLHLERGCLGRQLGRVIKIAVFRSADGHIILFGPREQRRYGCPSVSCPKTYENLSGLWQHLECHACGAWTRYGSQLDAIYAAVISKVKYI